MISLTRRIDSESHVLGRNYHLHFCFVNNFMLLCDVIAASISTCTKTIRRKQLLKLSTGVSHFRV